MKCLIVDDDICGQELLSTFLAEYVEIIDTAKDGVEAVELFAKSLREGNPYQLVCLDILMPVMNGQEALKQMRNLETEAEIAHTAASIIIMTTALDSINEIQEAIWNGDCNNYLVKPISQADIVGLLKKYRLIT